MHLEKAPEFEKTLERFEAWWHCEIIDRPLVTIGVKPERPAVMPVRQHATLRERWFDTEYALDRLEAQLETAVFVGDTFPFYEPTLGPEVCSTVFGCDLEFSESTSWSIPVVQSCRDILDIQPDLENPYWRNIREKTDASLARGKGRWITSIPDLHTNGDLVASLRNPEDTCIDCADDLEGVRLATEYVTDFFPMMYEDIYNRLAAAGMPSSTWAPFLHSGKAYVTSCDFICMISTSMFEEAILPPLVREMRYLDRNYFHLDGPDALRHLDVLMSLPELNGLQWIFGAGNGPAAKWIDVYKRVQAAGKCLDLPCEGIDDAKAVAEHIRPEGVWFRPGGGHTREEAEAFIRWVADWSAGEV